jgi:16S rRNA (guanine(966)-N(2))-methyltransferase RsmD
MRASRLYIKINAGKYKGRKLSLPSNATTRSTKSILKGSFFDSVQYEIVDKSIVEVFGGSGSIGLEGLSRGASEAYFIEINREAYKILEKNCSMIDKDSCYTYFGDSFETYPKIAQNLADAKKKAYLYFDPPFDIRDGMSDIYEKVMTLIANTPNEIVEMIVIEHMSNRDMGEQIGNFKKIKSKKFGKSMLSYYK